MALRSPRTINPNPRTSPENTTPAKTTNPARRKIVAAREWLVISSEFGCSGQEVGKQSIMNRTGLPARELRILDPLLSYPSSILGRERAIVVNFENVKAIITATEVFIPNSRDPLVAPFVEELKARVLNALNPNQKDGNGGKDGLASPNIDGSPRQTLELSQQTHLTLNDLISKDDLELDGTIEKIDGARYDVMKILPFEFRALEVCLESACKCLELETSQLEKEAYPALDELTSKISMLNLERVRQIKSRLVAISGRVQKVRDEVEHLLDDDMDMAVMHLTEKLARQTVSASSRFEIGSISVQLEKESDEEQLAGFESSKETLDGFNPDIHELEILLEAYFVQIDGTLNKLTTLKDYVDDTEDYINIMLDDKQNQLLQMGVVLSTATLIITAAIIVTGIFGMNIHISLYDSTTYNLYWEVFGGMIGGSILLFLLAIWWGKGSGLLQ